MLVSSHGYPGTRRKTIPGARAGTSLCGHGPGTPMRADQHGETRLLTVAGRTPARRQREMRCVGESGVVIMRGFPTGFGA